ncbi:MAG: helix-turn-helix transcriptional regulator, partial [Selenomonadaceae bacterium]|nr:helix-turn-helix transcriptional regulator [Selenomonadaceae bacterium]
MNERIRELRKRKGLNQTEFGAKLGLSQRAVANMESEGGTVTERNFDAICKAFNVNPEWLRHGVGEIFMETRESLLQSIVAEFDLTDGEAALMKT